MNYSFKFMETQADKDFAKKLLKTRLAKALLKTVKSKLTVTKRLTVSNKGS